MGERTPTGQRDNDIHRPVECCQERESKARLKRLRRWQSRLPVSISSNLRRPAEVKRGHTSNPDKNGKSSPIPEWGEENCYEQSKCDDSGNSQLLRPGETASQAKGCNVSAQHAMVNQPVMPSTAPASKTISGKQQEWRCREQWQWNPGNAKAHANEPCG